MLDSFKNNYHINNLFTLHEIHFQPLTQIVNRKL